MPDKIRIVFAGGGTGGHVFPALNIASTLSREWNTDILFFGTKRGLESTKVPEAGYHIEFIPVAGFQRRLTLKNMSFPWRLFKSIQLCRKVLRDFNPQ